MNFIRKHYKFLFLAVPTLYFALNIVGFCYRDRVIYTQKDLIGRYVALEISSHRDDVPSAIQSAADFLAAYRNCCQVVSSSNLLFRALGYGIWDVYIRYPLIRDGRERDYTVIYSVDCCGITWAKRVD